MLQKVAKQRLEARAELVKSLKPILDTYSKENNVSIIFNKKDILYGNSEFDVTNKIVELLNKKLPSLNLK